MGRSSWTHHPRSRVARASCPASSEAGRQGACASSWARHPEMCESRRSLEEGRREMGASVAPIEAAMGVTSDARR